jgi:hypothetical protein
MSTKNQKINFFRKNKKSRKFIKNGKNLLTNDKKCAKIVNCIIIARIVVFPCLLGKFFGNNLQKGVLEIPESADYAFY